MVGIFSGTAGPGVGLFCGATDRWMELPVNTAATEGDAWMVDESAVNSALEFFRLLQPATATEAFAHAIIGIALETVAAPGAGVRASVKLRFQGAVLKAKVNGATAIGAELSAVNASAGLAASATTMKVLGKATSSTAGAGFVSLSPFDGISGLGKFT